MFDIVKIILKDAQKSIKKISLIFLLCSTIFVIAILSIDERYTSKSKLLPVGASSSIGKNYNAILQNLAGDITSASGLTYSSSCQVGGADGVAQIDVTIGAGHGIAAGDLYYVHHDAGVADVNMSLTAVDVGGGVCSGWIGIPNLL